MFRGRSQLLNTLVDGYFFLMLLVTMLAYVYIASGR